MATTPPRKTVRKATSKVPETAAPAELRIKRSGLRVGILSLLSLGLYQLYWFHITRKQLNQELGEAATFNTVPVWLQTFGPGLLFILAIPLLFVLVGFLLFPVALVLSVALWYGLIKDLSVVRQRAGLSEISPGLYIVGYVALSMFFGAGVVIMAVLASNLNEYRDTQTSGKAQEAPYTSSEILVSVAGVLLGLLLIGLLIVASLAGAFDDKKDSDSFFNDSNKPSSDRNFNTDAY